MAVERFFIIKDGEREGPFDESYVRFLLEHDELELDDYCETADGERFRLGTLYETVEEGAGRDRSEDQGQRARQRPRRSGSGKGGTPPPARVLYVGHPSYLRYPIAWLLVAAGSIGGYLVGPHSLWGMIGCFGAAAAVFFYIVVERSSHVYVITPRRLEAVHGLVAKDSTEIRIDDIRTINVRRSGLPGLLGVGSVEFASVGDTVDVCFADVWSARRLKKLVRRLQDELDD